MRLSSETEHLSKKMGNLSQQNKTNRRKYFCSFVDHPFGLKDRYILTSILLVQSHIFGVYGCLMVVAAFLIAVIVGQGTTMGAHRLWTHKAYKAKLPLKIILAFLHGCHGQYPLFKWCRDHRIHHKYVDTDADPHNSRLGFWYSHVGWLLQKEHPAYWEKEKLMDFSDLDNDPVVRWQAILYWPILVPFGVYIIPMSIIGYLFPSLSYFDIFCANYIWYIWASHGTFLVNSAAHMFGSKPYDGSMSPTDNRLVAFFALGEGFHNYHHTFPWDCKAAELGSYEFNWTTMFLDFFTWIGWAYDLKTVPDHIVRDRVRRTGDGSHSSHHHEIGPTHDIVKKEEVNSWGWGDIDIPEEHYKMAKIIQPSKAR